MPHTLLLAPSELQDLTGYTVQAKQVAELQRLKIPYIVNARGRLCVSRTAAEQRLGVHFGAMEEEPDFEAMG